LRSAAASKQSSWLIERFIIPNGILGRIGFRGRQKKNPTARPGFPDEDCREAVLEDQYLKIST
jgi:hypothetical protein